MEANTTATPLPTASDAPISTPSGPVPVHHANPTVAFIIGLAIIILASILNAAGLNLTKLDHVRTSAMPKAARARVWLRPLWLLGMVLYILSQLIGSTLALEYMRAEYVAPLGSTSLIFNFLFAKFLVNTPVTKYDIYGTVIVILGVIGIVAFGSINHGLATETDATHLTALWTRGNWLAYFLFMAFALIFLYLLTSQLDLILATRSDLSSVPFAGMRGRTGGTTLGSKVLARWENLQAWTGERIEAWSAPHDDKRIAWTLGILWACCGGTLAGACLVFAKAVVKLISGAISHENEGNQFGHASVIFTFIILATTAVFQIICLNKGLQVYDSTLVVPVFYGVYTALGFLNSLIFNDEVDAYEPWTLFLVFVAMIILISGVVLLTYKKPEDHGANTTHATAVPLTPRGHRASAKGALVGDEEEALHEPAETDEAWQLGDASEDEDDEERGNAHMLRSPRRANPRLSSRSRSPRPRQQYVGGGDGEQAHMLADEDDEDGEEGRRRSSSSDATLAQPNSAVLADEAFGAWGRGADAKLQD